MDLGLSSDEFYGLTPRQFDALCTQHQRRRRIARRESDQVVAVMMSQLIAMVANTGFRKFERPRQPEEFMPRYRDSEERLKKPRRNNAAFTLQMELTMERAIAYQKAQAARGRG